MKDGCTADEIAEEADFQRRWGPVEPLVPTEVAELLAGFDRPWWVVGGWAIDAFTGSPRHHDDIDVAVLAPDLPRLRQALAGWHLWSAGPLGLRPIDDRTPDLAPQASQVWVRRHARAPWVADLLVHDVRDGRVVSRREPAAARTLEELTWLGPDGVRYARPEDVLHHKARQARPKDERDLARAWPRLDEPARERLREALARTEPGHPWIARLAASE